MKSYNFIYGMKSAALPLIPKVLRGFERISLKAGEEQTVHFRLRPQDLGLWDKNMNFRVELGSFKVMLGASSTDIRLHGQFEITP